MWSWRNGSMECSCDDMGRPHSAKRIFDVGAQHVEQFVGGFLLVARALMVGVGHVHEDVILDNLGHETVDRAARGGQEPHHLAASLVRFERAFERVDLAAQAADPVQELLLAFDDVCHCSPRKYPNGYIAYTHGGMYMQARETIVALLRLVRSFWRRRAHQDRKEEER